MLACLKRKSYKELVVLEACHPPVSTHFSQRSHGGILEPADCSFSSTLVCCDTHTRAQTHTYTHACKHTYTASLTQGLQHSLSHREDNPLSFESSQSPFTRQNPHTPRPVCLGHTHTHTLPHMHTHFTKGPSPYCHSIWLVPFVPHVLSALTESCSKLVVPHDGGACPDLWETYVMT